MSASLFDEQLGNVGPAGPGAFGPEGPVLPHPFDRAPHGLCSVCRRNDRDAVHEVGRDAVGLVRTDAPSTSREAAWEVAPRTGTQRWRVLEYVREHGPATDEAIQVGLAMSGNTQRPRRVELVAGGWLAELDQEGRTASGDAAIRWSLTAKART